MSALPNDFWTGRGRRSLVSLPNPAVTPDAANGPDDESSSDDEDGGVRLDTSPWQSREPSPVAASRTQDKETSQISSLQVADPGNSGDMTVDTDYVTTSDAPPADEAPIPSPLNTRVRLPSKRPKVAYYAKNDMVRYLDLMEAPIASMDLTQLDLSPTTMHSVCTFVWAKLPGLKIPGDIGDFLSTADRQTLIYSVTNGFRKITKPKAMRSPDRQMAITVQALVTFLTDMFDSMYHERAGYPQRPVDGPPRDFFAHMRSVYYTIQANKPRSSDNGWAACVTLGADALERVVATCMVAREAYRLDQHAESGRALPPKMVKVTRREASTELATSGSSSSQHLRGFPTAAEVSASGVQQISTEVPYWLALLGEPEKDFEVYASRKKPKLPKGREHKHARKEIRQENLMEGLGIAVDRWLRFVNIELPRKARA